MVVLESLGAQIRAGGFCMIPIIGVGVIMFAMTIRRGILVCYSLRDLSRLEQDGVAALFHVSWLAPMCAQYAEIRSRDAEINNTLRDKLQKRFINNMRTDGKAVLLCASLATLLGLLGTVSGMILSFEAIQVYGAGNTKSVAAGISVALITTQTGLLVGVPGVIAGQFLTRMTSRLQTRSILFFRELETFLAKGEEAA